MEYIKSSNTVLINTSADQQSYIGDRIVTALDIDPTGSWTALGIDGQVGIISLQRPWDTPHVVHTATGSFHNVETDAKTIVKFSPWVDDDDCVLAVAHGTAITIYSVCRSTHTFFEEWSGFPDVLLTSKTRKARLAAERDGESPTLKTGFQPFTWTMQPHGKRSSTSRKESIVDLDWCPVVGSPHQFCLVTITSDGNMCVWNIGNCLHEAKAEDSSSEERVERMPQILHKYSAFCSERALVKWHRHHHNWIASSHDSEVRMWDLSLPDQPTQCNFIGVHDDLVLSLDWHVLPSKEWFLLTSSRSFDGRSVVNVYDVAAIVEQRNGLEHRQPSRSFASVKQPVETVKFGVNLHVHTARWAPFGHAFICDCQCSNFQLRLHSLLPTSAKDGKENDPVILFGGHTAAIQCWGIRTMPYQFPALLAKGEVAQVHQLLTCTSDGALKLWRCTDRHIAKCVDPKDTAVETPGDASRPPPSAPKSLFEDFPDDNDDESLRRQKHSRTLPADIRRQSHSHYSAGSRGERERERENRGEKRREWSLLEEFENWVVETGGSGKTTATIEYDQDRERHRRRSREKAPAEEERERDTKVVVVVRTSDKTSMNTVSASQQLDLEVVVTITKSASAALSPSISVTAATGEMVKRVPTVQTYNFVVHITWKTVHGHPNTSGTAAVHGHGSSSGAVDPSSSTFGGGGSNLRALLSPPTVSATPSQLTLSIRRIVVPVLDQCLQNDRNFLPSIARKLQHHLCIDSNAEGLGRLAARSNASEPLSRGVSFGDIGDAGGRSNTLSSTDTEAEGKRSGRGGALLTPASSQPLYTTDGATEDERSTTFSSPKTANRGTAGTDARQSHAEHGAFDRCVPSPPLTFAIWSPAGQLVVVNNLRRHPSYAQISRERGMFADVRTVEEMAEHLEGLDIDTGLLRIHSSDAQSDGKSLMEIAPHAHRSASGRLLDGFSEPPVVANGESGERERENGVGGTRGAVEGVVADFSTAFLGSQRYLGRDGGGGDAVRSLLRGETATTLSDSAASHHPSAIHRQSRHLSPLPMNSASTLLSLSTDHHTHTVAGRMQNARVPGPVAMYELSPLLPVQSKIAAEYMYIPSSRSFLHANSEDMTKYIDKHMGSNISALVDSADSRWRVADYCKTNAQVGLRHHRPDVAWGWLAVANALQPSIRLDSQLSGAARFPEELLMPSLSFCSRPSVVGSRLLDEVFAYFDGINDFQSLAMMAALLLQFQRCMEHLLQWQQVPVTIPSTTTAVSSQSSRTASGSKSASRTPYYQLISQQLSNTRLLQYVLRYADQLWLWELQTQRLELLTSVENIIPRHYSLQRMLNDNIKASLSVGLLWPDTGTFVESTFNAQGVCMPIPMTCAFCHIRVRGHTVFCMECGHGGHDDHMDAWFREENVCPSPRCGCYCRGMPAEVSRETAQLSSALGGADTIANVYKRTRITKLQSAFTEHATVPKVQSLDHVAPAAGSREEERPSFLNQIQFDLDEEDETTDGGGEEALDGVYVHRDKAAAAYARPSARRRAPMTRVSTFGGRVGHAALREK